MTVTLIILLFLGLIVFLLYYKARQIRRMPEAPQSARILNLDPSNFNQQIKNGITLVDFWASWCMPCKMLAPILNEVAEEVNGKARIAKLNIEKHQALANQYKVRSIPTLILFRNGKEIDRIVGVKNKEYLVSKIERAKIL
ncbi:MAG TPA: thioredoxin [Bacteroidales bacterium]|nr:thioredoxin [Bacteroidales bacterium]HSA44181.1 thioredoxin [Bacteroidales bacterium]